MRRLVGPLLLALALLAAGLGAAQAQTNPFGRPAPGGPATTAPEAKREATPAAAPALVDRWYAALRRWQSELTRSLASEVRAYKEEGALRPVLALLLISFLYGVAHAVGPGHGKAATAAFFGANRARAVNGITMSAMIGLVQALSAVVFVGIFALLFQVSQTQTVRSVLYVEVASYALIAAVGLWIAWGGVVGRGCTHEHGLGAHAHGHDHAHHQHDGGAHMHAIAAAGTPGVTLRSMLPVAVASGLRPCTGAILVLLFTLTQGIFEIGILATLVMSLGTFLVVALIGLGAIYARRAASRAGGRNERLANIAQRGVSLAGGLVVTAFGSLFLLSSIQQLGYQL
jgi:nickel/cobalt exporter